MFAAIAQTGGGSDKVSKVGVERVIREGEKDVGAEAGCWAGRSIKPVTNGRRSFSERVKRMNPRGRFGVCIGQDEGDIRTGVVTNSRAGSASEAVSHCIVQQIVGI